VLLQNDNLKYAVHANEFVRVMYYLCKPNTLKNTEWTWTYGYTTTRKRDTNSDRLL